MLIVAPKPGDNGAVHGILVFDGACGFCTRTVLWLRRLDRGRRVEPVPYQRPGVLESARLTERQASTTIHWLGADGSWYSGAHAANAALSAALGTRLPLLLYRLTRWPQERLYAVIAANRHRLPGVTPHCTSHPQDCGPS